MSLRHFFIASSLILAPITTLGFGSAAFADIISEDIILSGTVESRIAIDATPTTAASDLPLSPSQTGWETVKVAMLEITNNNPAGITITADSINDGKLVSSANSSDAIPYGIAIINYGSQAPAAIPMTPLSSVNQSVTSGFNADSGKKAMDLYIRYPVEGLKQGNYSDTLTITVSDN
ncbi:hypothetical protein [Planktothrix agardhii]|uniref:hypothetical protein n=1 Tax=Planktothrix agardhii TaxID=1160 RepID=UPI0020B3C415|nr:hypothetical protein [Planktothrix agardhii]CAD5971542.1 hypothetical protein PCC7811_03805 [Planktothrix agardhii]